MQQGFPTWRYHRTNEPKLVHSPEELKALGAEWADTPAAFESKPIENKFDELMAEIKTEADEEKEAARPKRSRKAKGE